MPIHSDHSDMIQGFLAVLALTFIAAFVCLARNFPIVSI